MKSSSQWTVAGLVVVPLVFVFMIVLLWRLDFFEFSGTEASAKIVATALTLGGGLIATMVTLIGLLLRQSVEQRNADLREEAEERLRIEAERNRALQEEAERRLKLEAAIKAVGLLGSDTGAEVSLIQRTGVLFSLSHLGVLDLAIDLVGLMLEDHLISAKSAVTIINTALQSDDTRVQIAAAEILRDQSASLLTPGGGLEWPVTVGLNWGKELSFLSKVYAILGLLRSVLARPKKDWKGVSLNAIVAFLVVAYRSENDWRIQAPIAHFLREMLKLYGPATELHVPDETIQIAAVRHEIAGSIDVAIASSFASLIGQFPDWLEGRPPTISHDGDA